MTVYGTKQQFQPFRTEAVLEPGKASDVAAQPRQTLDETGTDRIDDGGEHDWQPQHRHARHARIDLLNAAKLGLKIFHACFPHSAEVRQNALTNAPAWLR